MSIFNSQHAFRDKTAEISLFRARAWFIGIIIFALLIVLGWRMVHLQIELHDTYKNLSENNRIQLRPIAPNRGLIYDRNGILLAENIPAYRLTLVLERIENLDITISELQQLIDISERDLEQFEKRRNLRRRPYEPITLKSSLDESEIAKILVNRSFLPGVDVEATLVRHYPHDNVFAHVLGYVGRINQRDQTTLDADATLKKRYSVTQHIGKTGVERRYERRLHGDIGYQKIETNARGRIISVIEQVDPIPGNDITLHLDLRLQKIAQQELQGRRGAVAAIDVATGGILALYSNPSFDPNSFVTGISHKAYAELRDNLDTPLFDRATRGQYPPASTLKPFLGLAALDSGATNWNRVIDDPGFYQLPNDDRLYRDWKRDGHGKINLKSAIVESCDIYFYDVAIRTGIDEISPFLRSFGFGSDTTEDVISSVPGILPDRNWKRSRRRGSWFPGDTVNLGIGQGFMTVTPLQLAIATSVLANKGQWKTPHLLMAENSVAHQPSQVSLPNLELEEEHWQRMSAAMQGVIENRKGTARSLLRNLKFPIAGKTGTAQVVSIAQGEKYDSEALQERQRDHAWFMAYAPIDNPQIAIAVIIENGESAGATAAPVAQKIINEYLGGAEG